LIVLTGSCGTSIACFNEQERAFKIFQDGKVYLQIETQEFQVLAFEFLGFQFLEADGLGISRKATSQN